MAHPESWRRPRYPQSSAACFTHDNVLYHTQFPFSLTFVALKIRLVNMTSQNGIEMREVQASEAKTHLPRLLDEVERGETIVITRHGRAIARIVPEVTRRQAEIARAVEDLRALRRSIAARGESLSWDELKAFRDEGRR